MTNADDICDQGMGRFRMTLEASREMKQGAFLLVVDNHHARIDELHGEYYMFIGEGKPPAGPVKKQAPDEI
jgi:hypothetical protein